MAKRLLTAGADAPRKSARAGDVPAVARFPGSPKQAGDDKHADVHKCPPNAPAGDGREAGALEQCQKDGAAQQHRGAAGEESGDWLDDEGEVWDEEEDEDIQFEGSVVCSNDDDCRCPSCRGGETVRSAWWNQLYVNNFHHNVHSEYLLSHFTLKPAIEQLLEGLEVKDKPALVPGCGDSPFGYQMRVESGFKNVLCTDISTAALEVLERKFGATEGFGCRIDDMTASSLASDSFGTVLDKSLIDCMFWCDDPNAHPDVLVASTLGEYYRVLAPGGVAVVVTIRCEDEFGPFLDMNREHLVPEWQERREKAISMDPDGWAWRSMAIRVGTVEGDFVPADAMMTVVEDQEEDDPPETKRFYLYLLEKHEEAEDDSSSTGDAKADASTTGHVDSGESPGNPELATSASNGSAEAKGSAPTACTSPQDANPQESHEKDAET